MKHSKLKSELVLFMTFPSAYVIILANASATQTNLRGKCF